MFVLSLVLVAVGVGAVQGFGPQDGGSVFGWRILPRAKDRSCPTCPTSCRDSAIRAADRRTNRCSRRVCGPWYSFRLVLVGFAIGIVAGVCLAVVMTRFGSARGLLPYLVISQTIPLIALAPLIVSWGGKVHVGGLVWERWMSASLLGAFLSFFPIAVGTLRGCSRPPAASLELMDSLAAPWRRDAVQAAVPGGGAVHGSGVEAGCGQRGDRRRRLGDLDRACAAGSVGW